MSQQLKRHAIILGACAGLIAGCAAGDETDDYAEQGDGFAQMVGHDAGMAADHPHDGGAAGHDAGSPAGHDAGMPDMHGGADGGMQHNSAEPCRATHPTYRAGLSQKAGAYTVELVSASPAPPRQQVPNDWVIRILDAAGQPLAGAKVDNADTFMGVHGHGGAFDPAVEAGAGPGEWKLVDLDFTMRGPWEVSFDLTPAGSTRPSLVTFNICVE